MKNPQIIFDTDIRGRTRSISYEDAEGGIENLSVTEGFDEKGRRTYITYTPFYGKPWNKFTRNKKEIALMEMANTILGIEE